MKKKDYIKPEMQVYEVRTQQILAGSPDIYDNAPGDNNELMG